VLTASAHYLRPPQPGAALVDAEVLRDGRTAGHIRARLLQHDRVCVEALIATGHIDRAAKPRWSAVTAPAITDFDHCVRLASRAPDGTAVPIMRQVEIRLDPV
jgi:hypothetical protein